MKREEVIAFNQENVSTGLSKKGYGYAYFAKRDFQPNEKIMEGFGRVIDHQTSHMSVQIGPNRHYVPEKWTGRYWNHSCEPNCYIRTRKDGFPSVYALQKIKKGEEITYFYAMTEYSWAKICKENNVKCLCGSKTCSGKILSFSQLSPVKQKEFKAKGMCSEHLIKLVK